MLKNKFFVKASILILIFVVITGSIYLYKYNVLKSDQNQIEVLYNIFNEICNEDESINLTNSALINFITKKEFKDKTLLLELQTKNKDADNQNVELSIKYNKRNNILTVYKEKSDKTYIFVQNYKLSVNFNNIEYQKYGDFSETISYK